MLSARDGIPITTCWVCRGTIDPVEVPRHFEVVWFWCDTCGDHNGFRRLDTVVLQEEWGHAAQARSDEEYRKRKARYGKRTKVQAPERLRSREATRVYLIRNPSSGLTKIGLSATPEQRLKVLQTACGETLRLLGSVAGDLQLERSLHQRYESRRQQGEWFGLTDEDCESILSDADHG